MLLYSLNRCIIFCLLVTTILVDSQDLFNIFNDVKEQVAKKVDDASAKVKEKVIKHVLDIKDGEKCPTTYTTEYRTVLTAYRHVVQDWIEKFPSKDAKEYRFSVELSSDEYDRLHHFASSSHYEQKEVLHEVHVISDLLKRIVTNIEQDKPDFTGLTWAAWLRSFDINAIIKGVLAAIAVGAITFISVRIHLRRGRWLTMFFIVAFVVSFAQNWWTLYQDAQAKVDEVLMKKLPKHCQGHSRGFFDSIKAKLGRLVDASENECLQYHKALRAVPHAQVTPFQALSMTFAQLFTTPLGAIGEGLSQFFYGTTLHVPVLLWPFVIVIIVIIILFLILMYSRYEVHLPFMLGSLRPSRHAAITTTTNVVEQTEMISNDRVHQLESQVKELQVKLEQNKLQLEHNATSPTRASRSSSIDRTNQQRERSSSNRRLDTPVTAENDLRQRTTSTDIGFKKEFLSN